MFIPEDFVEKKQGWTPKLYAHRIGVDHVSWFFPVQIQVQVEEVQLTYIYIYTYTGVYLCITICMTSQDIK